MRISKVQLAGLVAALAGGAAQNAAADDFNVTTALTDPVFTATAQGGTAGDVTIASGGSITVDANESAVTVNSNNDVTNSGQLASIDDSNATGIRLNSGFAGTITNTSTITLTETYAATDTDNDNIPDGPFAQGLNRTGILLDAGSFTGNIAAGGSIIIEGVNSAGIRLNGLLGGDGVTTGNLTVSGAVTVIGDNSHGIVVDGAAAGGVAGDVLITGAVTVRGEDASAVILNGDVGGEVRIRSNLTATGFRLTTRPATLTDIDPAEDLLIGGPAVAIHRSVGGGVVIAGIGVEDDTDDDGDGQTEAAGDTDDDATATITSLGTGAAVLISADASANLVLGAITGPLAPAGAYGFHNQGIIRSSGVYDNLDATGVRIEGILAGSSVNIGDGFYNDGEITAAAFQADATALSIGPNVIGNAGVNIVNNNTISAGSVADNAQVYGVRIESDAQIGELVNTSIISVQLTGEAGGATAILDESGNLTNIENSGRISARITAPDADPVTATAVAIDLSNASSFVTLTQIENADPDSEIEVGIVGDVILSDFNDVVGLQTGSLTGALSFGLGSDSISLSGGATYSGVITDLGGDLVIGVTEGTLELLDSALTTGAVTFGNNTGTDDSILVVQVPETPGAPTITANGAVTFGADAAIRTILPNGLPAGGSFEFLDAIGGLTGADNVTGLVSGEGTPFLYNVSIAEGDELAAEGAANSLLVNYSMKSATQLGLTDNQTNAFAPLIAAATLDDTVSAALRSLDSAVEFFDAYDDLMPSYSSAATEIAATAIQQMQSATANRLAATRLHDLNDTSVWAQEIGYGITRTPPTANGQEYSGAGFGIATGIDGPLENGALFGLSASFVASEVEEDGRPDGQIAMSIGQLNAYFGTAMGSLDIDAIVGVGIGKLSSERAVAIGDSFTALSEADWWTYEGHAALRVSAPMAVSQWLIMSPQAALTYAYMQEESYTEEGGGVAIDYEADAASSQRLWGDVGVEFSGRLNAGGQTVISPRLFAGYRANLIDEGAERTFRFVSGADEFTLTDEGSGDGAPLVGIGVDASNGYSTFSLGYEGEFGDQIERHSVNASVRFRF